MTASMRGAIDAVAVVRDLVRLRRAGDVDGMERVRATLTPVQIDQVKQEILDQLTVRTVRDMMDFLRGIARPVVTVEPLTEALRECASRRFDLHAFAVVERDSGGAVTVHETADSEWYARRIAWSYVDTHDATLALTALQITRGDILIDDHGQRHIVSSIYPVDQLSVTVHTNSGHHEHLTWSEALLKRYVIDTREVTK